MNSFQQYAGPRRNKVWARFASDSYCLQSAAAVASYAYTLDFAGHRTGVTELSGRAVTYTYDNIYRLTSETIASDPNSINGAVSYTYDNVGNRTQLTSTLAPVPAATWSYDAND